MFQSKQKDIAYLKELIEERVKIAANNTRCILVENLIDRGFLI